MVLLAEFDTGDRVRDLARYKLESAALTFVVEEDARHGEHVVALTVILGDPVTVQLRNAVRAAGMELGLFVVAFARPVVVEAAVHFGGRRLVETNFVCLVGQANGLKHVEHALTGNLSRQDWVFE